MPLFSHYTKAMSECPLADLNNTGFPNVGRAAGACNAAAYLRVSDLVTLLMTFRDPVSGGDANG